MSGRLGCAEMCLGGELENKLRILQGLGLWLELANFGPRDLSALDSYDVEVRTVQAYRLHELQWLSVKAVVRDAAYHHILDTIRIAEDVGAEHVLTVPTYGFDQLEKPRQKCIENYRRISKETHLTILIEALSPKQTSFSPSLQAVAQLVDEISRDNIGIAADTWHIKESGNNVVETLRELGGRVVALHLRDTDSKPPGKGAMDFREILKACSPELLCLEFKTGVEDDVVDSYRHLRSIGLEEAAAK